jgi:hypothetical protein
VGITWTPGASAGPQPAPARLSGEQYAASLPRRMAATAAEMTAELHRRDCLPAVLHLGWVIEPDPED